MLNLAPTAVEARVNFCSKVSLLLVALVALMVVSKALSS